MRPSGATAVASVKIKPVRPRATAVRCEKWKPLASPSLAEYMQSGERATRLGSVTDRSVMGENSRGMDMRGFLEGGFAASLVVWCGPSSLVGSPQSAERQCAEAIKGLPHDHKTRCPCRASCLSSARFRTGSLACAKPSADFALSAWRCGGCFGAQYCRRTDARLAAIRGGGKPHRRGWFRGNGSGRAQCS